MPSDVRPSVAAVYAFARTADDIADEGGHTTPAARLAGLDAMERSLLAAENGSASDEEPIFIALADTFRRTRLPVQPFLDLLTAFRMDVQFRQPQTWDEVLFYCRHSADPVGEIILRLTGEYTPATAASSSAVCTALQLTNFWQDRSRDLVVGRNYLPPGISLTEAMQRTYALFVRGSQIGDEVRGMRLRLELRLIVLAGHAVLQRCMALGEKLQTSRPALATSDYFALLGRLFLGRWRLHEHTRIHR